MTKNGKGEEQTDSSREYVNIFKKEQPIELQSLSSKREASWPSVLFYIHLNILGLYGFIVLFTTSSILTILFTVLLTFFGTLGATAGAHRLWAHQTFKASKGLRVFLMICQTLAGQGSIYHWVQAHRLHHQAFKTDDDPFYSHKDFLNAQVFAQVRNYSPRQEELLKRIDMADIEKDKVVMFQKRFYWLLYAIIFALLPVNAPLEYWGDNVHAAVFVAFSLRYLIVLNVCWLINSAHFIWGLDKNHKPSDSNLIFLVTKSYWPHFHYNLPWDYATGEFGDYGEDCTTAFIRIFAAMRLATDLQTASTEAVKQGLTMAVETHGDVAECIRICAKNELENSPQDHYLRDERCKPN